MPFCGVKVFLFLSILSAKEGSLIIKGREDAFLLAKKKVFFPNPVSAPMPETPHSNAQYGRLGRRMGSQSHHSQCAFLHMLAHSCPLSAPTVFQTLDTGQNNTKAKWSLPMELTVKWHVFVTW